MSTAKSAEQLALRGLLLVVVEVQNLVRAEMNLAESLGEIDGIEQIRQVVESAPTAELVQLARAALEMPTPRAIPAAAASMHS